MREREGGRERSRCVKIKNIKKQNYINVLKTIHIKERERDRDRERDRERRKVWLVKDR